MFGSTVIEVGIGMALLFLFASLIATAAQEFLEGLLQKRGKDLERGIRELLNDPRGGWITNDFYNHPLIASLYPGEYRPNSRTLPSYIPASSFALALLDIVARGPTTGRPSAQPFSITVADCQTAAGHFPDGKVRRMLLAALDTSGGDIMKAQKTLELAFDATMDRVSGWYRRRTQWVLAAVGIATAVVLNIDAITVAQRLGRDDALRKAVVAASSSAALGGEGQRSRPVEEIADDLRKIGYPIGWTWSAQDETLVPGPQACKVGQEGEACKMTADRWAMMMLGWLITALAIMLGAPFWFDVLNKFMVIRSTVKPREKSREEGSEDRA